MVADSPYPRVLATHSRFLRQPERVARDICLHRLTNTLSYCRWQADWPLPLLRALWERRSGQFKRVPMRAAIFRNGEIVVDSMPDPKPGAGQVLVKTLACGICGSDLHARKHAHRMVEMSKYVPGRKPMDLSRDVVFGHEFCCEILDYGPGTQ